MFEPTYTFKENPYGVIHLSKFKLSDLKDKKRFDNLPKKWYFRIPFMKAFAIGLFKFSIRFLFGKSYWLPVTIYQCLYENADGDVWVRDRERFNALFKIKIEKGEEDVS